MTGKRKKRISPEQGSQGTKKSKQGSLPIKTPGSNDVLMGRGSRVNEHNKATHWRALVDQQKFNYHQKETAIGKRNVAMEIVTQLANLDPPARFLDYDEKTKHWYQVEERFAREKTMQALRHDAAEAKNAAEEERFRNKLSSLSSAPSYGNDSALDLGPRNDAMVRHRIGIFSRHESTTGCLATRAPFIHQLDESHHRAASALQQIIPVQQPPVVPIHQDYLDVKTTHPSYGVHVGDSATEDADQPSKASSTERVEQNHHAVASITLDHSHSSVLEAIGEKSVNIDVRTKDLSWADNDQSGLDNNETAHAALKSSLSILQHSNEVLQQQSTSISQTLSDMQSQLQDLKQANAVLQQEASQLKQTCEDLSNQKNALIETLKAHLQQTYNEKMTSE